MAKMDNKEMLIWLCLADELERLNISVDDIENIELKNGNIEVKLKGSIEYAEITVDVKEQQ